MPSGAPESRVDAMGGCCAVRVAWCAIGRKARLSDRFRSGRRCGRRVKAARAQEGSVRVPVQQPHLRDRADMAAHGRGRLAWGWPAAMASRMAGAGRGSGGAAGLAQRLGAALGDLLGDGAHELGEQAAVGGRRDRRVEAGGRPRRRGRPPRSPPPCVRAPARIAARSSSVRRSAASSASFVSSASRASSTSGSRRRRSTIRSTGSVSRLSRTQVRAAAVPRLHQALDLQHHDRLLHRGPADPEPLGEIPLGRQPVARAQPALGDVLRAAAPAPARRGADWSSGAVRRRSSGSPSRRERNTGLLVAEWLSQFRSDPLTGARVAPTLISQRATKWLSHSATPACSASRSGAQRREPVMSPELISILVLVVVFVIATTRSVNMGALAFAAAFGVGELVAGLDADGIFAGFPGDLFVVLVGVTYLFAHRPRQRHHRLAGARRDPAGAGAGGADPLGDVRDHRRADRDRRGQPGRGRDRRADRAELRRALRDQPAADGRDGGARRPGAAASPRSASTARSSTASSSGRSLPGNEIALFLASLVANLLIAAVVFVVFGGLKLWARGRVTGAPRPCRGGASGREADGGAADAQPTPGAPHPGPHRHPGRAWSPWWSRSSSSTWTPASPRSPSRSRSAPCGRTTAQAGGQRGHLAHRAADLRRPHLRRACWTRWAPSPGRATGVTDIGVPLLAALLLCYIGAIVSAFASSVGIMGALIPLAVPFLAQGRHRRGRA